MVHVLYKLKYHQECIESPRMRGHATRDHQKLYEYIHLP